MKEAKANAIFFFLGAVFALLVWYVFLSHTPVSSIADAKRAVELGSSFSAVQSDATNVAGLDAQAQESVSRAGTASQKIGRGLTTAISQSSNIGTGVQSITGDLGQDTGESQKLASGFTGDIQLLDEIIKLERSLERTNNTNANDSK